MSVCMSMHQQQSNLIVVLTAAAGGCYLGFPPSPSLLRHCFSELHSWREPPPHPCKAMYVVSRVHLGIFTPRLGHVDRRVQNNPSYYLPPLRCWLPHSCCSVCEENVFVRRMLQLYIPTTEPLSKDTTVVYTWVQGHDTRTIVVPEAKVTTMEVYIKYYIYNKLHHPRVKVSV